MTKNNRVKQWAEALRGKTDGSNPLILKKAQVLKQRVMDLQNYVMIYNCRIPFYMPDQVKKQRRLNNCPLFQH